MKKEFDNNYPIYVQIMNEIKMEIVSGILKPNDKIMSVRELSQSFGVNPNTMQRALSELERENLLYSERTSGRYITSDEDLIKNVRNGLAEKELEKFVLYMKSLGFEEQEILDEVKKTIEGKV